MTEAGEKRKKRLILKNQTGESDHSPSESAKVNEERLQRIYEITNTSVQSELAEILDIRQSSISDAKRRHSIPSDWYMKLLEKYGVNPLYIKYAAEPRYIMDVPDTTVTRFSMPSCSVEELFKELFRRWLPDELVQKVISSVYVSPYKFKNDLELLGHLDVLLRRLLPGDLVEELFEFYEKKTGQDHKQPE